MPPTHDVGFSFIYVYIYCGAHYINICVYVLVHISLSELVLVYTWKTIHFLIYNICIYVYGDNLRTSYVALYRLKIMNFPFVKNTHTSAMSKYMYCVLQYTHMGKPDACATSERP